MLLTVAVGVAFLVMGIAAAPFIMPISFYWGDSRYTLTGIRPGGYRDGVVEPGLRTSVYYSFIPSEEATLGLGRIGYALETGWLPRYLRERYGARR